MKILITGTSRGIGQAVALRYLSLGHDVVGLDILLSSIENKKYCHFVCDISKKEQLPDISDIDIIFNNASVQNSGDDISTNLVGTINVTEKYIDSPQLKSVLFNASASAHTGFEFPAYAASKGGVISYMKNVASRLASRGITVNSISLGGVVTDSNKEVMDDPALWNKIMEVTPLKKWMNLEEVCDWVIFLTLTNKSASGQDFFIDNGEKDLNNTFVWPN
ncbi:MAG: SDR family oxidoreductase [Erysipelotrichaceae bacterium]|jgi:3-oxoacyl-[acyl-carrier protein] reductase|nr:SDR family oxidoreductase [Erysipelotrichaceae bacterium]